MKALLSVLLPLLFACSYSAVAQEHTATVVSKVGDVQILTPNTGQAVGDDFEFDESLYTPHPAKIGLKVNAGEVVRTSSSGQIKVIYPNGDQVIVGPSTLYTIAVHDQPAHPGSTTTLKLFFGKVRAVISSDGPRNSMAIVTPAAIAGVRGTDFYVAHDETSGTDLSVLRGEVSFQAKGSSAPPESIKSGFSASVARGGSVRQTALTKPNLEAIRKINPHAQAADGGVSKEQREEIASLNEKARANVVKDMQKHTPETLGHPPDQKRSVEHLNEDMVQHHEKKAEHKATPAPTKAHKRHGH